MKGILVVLVAIWLLVVLLGDGAPQTLALRSPLSPLDPPIRIQAREAREVEEAVPAFEITWPTPSAVPAAVRRSIRARWLAR